MTNSIPSNAMERWVKKVAKKSARPVDWHFVGGRAVVLTTGDKKVVTEAINKLLPEHDRLFRKAVGPGFSDLDPPRYFFEDQ